MSSLVLSIISWSGFATTLLGVWLVARKMILGWWCALFSEVLWVWWAIATASWALLTLSSCLVVLNAYGAIKWQLDSNRH